MVVPVHKYSYAYTLGVEAFLYVNRGSNSEVCPLGKRMRMATPLFMPVCLHLL